MKNRTLSLLSLFAVAAGSALAGDIWVSDSTNLYLVDTATLNTLNTVALDYGGGSASNPSLDSLAYDSSNGLLYANAAGSLESIDPLSGLVTILPGTGLNTQVQLAFDGNGNLYGLDSSTGNFVSVALDGTTTVTSTATYTGGGFAFNPMGGYFETLNGASGDTGGAYADTLYQVDPLTGDSSALTGLSNRLIGAPSTFTVDGAGTIFAFCGTGSGSGSGSGSGHAETCDFSADLLSIDSSGRISDTGQFNGRDVVAAVPSFAPEPSAVILLLSGGIGLFAFRKKLRS